MYITSVRSSGSSFGEENRHSTCQRRVLGTETRNRLTEALVRVEIGWRLGGLVSSVGVGRVWTPLAIVHSSNIFFFYYNNKVLNKKMLEDM